MTLQIKVPNLPESVSDAVLGDWKIQVGANIARDEILIELETDKVALEVPAPQNGILTEILQPSGATVTSGDVLAIFEAGTKPTVIANSAAKDQTQTLTTTNVGKLSPAVRRLIEEHGIDPTVIQGTGKGSLILKQDILNYISAQVNPADITEPNSKALDSNKMSVVAEPIQQLKILGSQDRCETRVPMTRLRQTIANRLLHSQQSSALLTTFNEVDMQPVMNLRKQYKEIFAQKYRTKLGFMSFFVKASVTALQQNPLINAYIDGTDIVHQNYTDIGIAVSSSRGLIVPVLRDCGELSFAQIETQIAQYAVQAQDGTISLDDLTGGTFTITNGGVFGSLFATPIVNPPQSAILGMHTIKPRPVAINDEIVIRPMMYLALTYDHRIIDGKEAVEFLLTIKQCIEDPTRLLLDI